MSGLFYIGDFFNIIKAIRTVDLTGACAREGSMDQPEIVYEKVKAPRRDHAQPVELTEETMRLRMEKVLLRMREKGLDKLIVYCDAEHGGNFAYLTGFYTRFEEALMILASKDEDPGYEMTLVLGNENLSKAASARFSCRAVHAPQLSLPNQPDAREKSLAEILKEAGLSGASRIGVAGWKLLRGEGAEQLFDVPAFMLDAVREAADEDAELVNAAEVFIGEGGARTTNDANEIAHYEYGAALASDCVLDAMDRLDIGVSELELGDALQREGQHTCITTIAAAGKRFIRGNMFPTARRAAEGVPVSLTVGYAGGSSSRAAYAVRDASGLPEGAEKWLEELAIPYFRAYAHWLKCIRIGMTGGELFGEIERLLPRAEYGWSLCPGHLTAEEEWLCSPVYEGSKELLQSGMIFQIDIIPGKKGMSGVSAESTVVLADAALKAELRREYPALWERMQRRLDHMKNELGLELSEDVLPMCSGVAYMRPFMLDKERALRLR